VRRVLAEGHELHLLSREGSRRWRLLDIERHLQWHVAALHDQASVLQLVERLRPYWVFHRTVYGAYLTEVDVNEMVLTNILGTANLLHAARTVGVQAFVNTGSSAEYGAKDHAPHEDEVLEPNSHYAAIKASSTWMARHTALAFSMPVTTMRLYSVFGPLEAPLPHREAFPLG
jgi:UDP-glucose 4-epimerase